MKNRLLDSKGQALIETIFLLTGVTIILFATIQVCVIVTNEFICNEAAFAAARSLSVNEVAGKNEDGEPNNKALLTITPILAPHISANNLTFVPTGIKIDEKSFGIDRQSQDIVVYNVNLNYLVNTMFIKLIDPLGEKSYSYAGINLLKQCTRARMVKSPDENFYKKAYKDAEEFSIF